jgi:hypothetical protein
MCPDCGRELIPDDTSTPMAGRCNKTLPGYRGAPERECLRFTIAELRKDVEAADKTIAELRSDLASARARVPDRCKCGGLNVGGVCCDCSCCHYCGKPVTAEDDLREARARVEMTEAERNFVETGMAYMSGKIGDTTTGDAFADAHAKLLALRARSRHAVRPQG